MERRMNENNGKKKKKREREKENEKRRGYHSIGSKDTECQCHYFMQLRVNERRDFEAGAPFKRSVRSR